MYRGKVGLGVTTWKRPALYAECRDSVVKHLSGLVDEVVVVQDGGDDYITPVPKGWCGLWRSRNEGVGSAKNACLDFLWRLGCDHLFMIEDDTVVTSPRAVTGYVDAAAHAGTNYLTAHPWGEATTRMVEVDGPVTYWAYVGSWFTYMTRHGYEVGGGYAAEMGNVMGDIELPERWRAKGLCSGWGRLADATGSEAWVEPHCLTPDQSTIMAQPDWAVQHANAMRWWMEESDTPVPAELRPANEGRKSRRCLPATP